MTTMTKTKKPTKRDLRRYARDNPPRYKLKVNLEPRLYVWDEWISIPRPIAALLAPKVETHPLKGVYATVIVNQNNPTMRFNGDAHKGVSLALQGPDWKDRLPLGDGDFIERDARDAADTINQLARRLD